MSNKLFIAEHFIRFCIFSFGWSNRTNLDTVANKQGRGKKGGREGNGGVEDEKGTHTLSGWALQYL